MNLQESNGGTTWNVPRITWPKNTSDSWDIPWYITRECCITVLYRAMENTVTDTINATYGRRMMGRLDVTPSNTKRLSCFLIGCIFCGTVKITLSRWSKVEMREKTSCILRHAVENSRMIRRDVTQLNISEGEKQHCLFSKFNIYKQKHEFFIVCTSCWGTLISQLNLMSTLHLHLRK